MLIFMGHTKVNAHLIQEVGLWQINAFGLEVGGHVKHQAVRAFAQAGVVVQHAAGVATVGVESEALHPCRKLTLRGEQ